MFCSISSRSKLLVGLAVDRPTNKTNEPLNDDKVSASGLILTESNPKDSHDDRKVNKLSDIVVEGNEVLSIPRTGLFAKESNERNISAQTSLSTGRISTRKEEQIVTNSWGCSSENRKQFWRDLPTC